LQAPPPATPGQRDEASTGDADDADREEEDKDEDEVQEHGGFFFDDDSGYVLFGPGDDFNDGDEEQRHPAPARRPRHRYTGRHRRYASATTKCVGRLGRASGLAAGTAAFELRGLRPPSQPSSRDWLASWRVPHGVQSEHNS
jgi:hypothetical protein